jgi:DNA-directed RNA polymerase specialized sigma24 family protein
VERHVRADWTVGFSTEPLRWLVGRASDAHGSVASVGDRAAGAEAAAKLLKEDERLRKKIFVHAYKLTGNLPDAKDLAQQGMSRAIDPKRSPWDPDKQPSLLLHIGSLMNGLARNKRRGDGRHRAETYDTTDDLHPASEPTALERMESAEELARLEYWMDLLLARLEGDTLALDKIGLVCQGIDGAAEQAARLKCTVKDIYRANERIAYHVERVKRDAPDGARAAPSPGGARAVHPKSDGGPEAER